MAYNNLAWHAASSGSDLDNALIWAKKAVQLEPRDAGFQDTLGWVMHTRKQDLEALPAMKEAHALAPKDPGILYHLGVVYMSSGNSDLARSSFQQALAISDTFDGSRDAKARLAATGPQTK